MTRIDHTLTTLEGLERHEGHFLNWYDTSTRAPMRPHYVSTVDSGNLAAALITLAQALSDAAEHPQTVTQRLAGVVDTAGLLMLDSARSDADATGRRQVADLHQLARRAIEAARVPAGEGDLETLEELGHHLADADLPVDPNDGADDLAVLEAGAYRRDRRHPRCDGARRPATHRNSTRWQVVPHELADDMRFDFLYDRRRRMFTIGYRLARCRRARPPRRLVLRSARLRGTPRELRRDRQGRRAAAPLVPPRAPGDEHRRARHADVVGRHDVRVPDAAAGDAHVPGHAARPELPRERASAQIEYGRRRHVPVGRL